MVLDNYPFFQCSKMKGCKWAPPIDLERKITVAVVAIVVVEDTHPIKPTWRTLKRIKMRSLWGSWVWWGWHVAHQILLWFIWTISSSHSEIEGPFTWGPKFQVSLMLPSPNLWLIIIEVGSLLFYAEIFEGLGFRVGSIFLIYPTHNTSPKPQVLPCRHPCQSWDLGLGILCEPALRQGWSKYLHTTIQQTTCWRWQDRWVLNGNFIWLLHFFYDMKHASSTR